MEENLIKRIQPHSVEAEQSVIGSMLMDKDAIVVASEMIRAEDFYQNACGVMFGAIVELYNEGKTVDLVTLLDRLREKEVPEEVCSLDFMRDLLTMVPTSANIRQYAQIVYDKALLRRLIKLNDEISNVCYAGKEPIEEILDYTEKNMFALLQNKSAGDYEPIQDVVFKVIKKIEQASQNRSVVTGLATGFTDLDYRTAGLQNSDLILLAARPSMGKTAFSLNLMEYITVAAGHAAAIFSLEMSREQLVNRLLAMESRVDSQKLRTGRLEEREWDQLIESSGVIANTKLIIDDTPGISVSELRSKCRKYKLEYDIKVIVIDYLQLMRGTSAKASDNRQQEISEISRSLKALARELNIPVIACSQLSRACETRPDHRPMLSDLRESGAIEQDADVVMFLYRDEYYNKDSESKGIAEVIIAKQRNGPVGTVELAWLPELTRFANLEK